MRKRIVLVLLLVLTAAGGLFAQGDKETSVEEKEITVLYLFDKPWYEQAESFTEKTGIKVNYIAMFTT